jgi:hypothetical protein
LHPEETPLARLNLGTPLARHPLDYDLRCRAGL